MKEAAYGSWVSMIERCTNPKNQAYVYYGARGITVCKRWLNSFEAFRADMGPRPFRKTLDRKDNDGNYEPGNCKWATAKEQGANKRKPGSVLRRRGPRKPPRARTDFRLPYGCRFPGCRARLTLKREVDPAKALSDAGWRVHGDGLEPALAPWAELCRRHASPVPENMTLAAFEKGAA